jgi:hypothetical protein
MTVFMGSGERFEKYVVGTPADWEPEPKFRSDDSGASLRGDVETCRRRTRFRAGVKAGKREG